MANGKSLKDLESAVLDGRNLVCSARVELELATSALEDTFKASNVELSRQQTLLFELDAAIRCVVEREKALAVAEERLSARVRVLS